MIGAKARAKLKSSAGAACNPAELWRASARQGSKAGALRRARWERRRSFWCVRLSDSRRNRRCTRACPNASRPPWRACNDASSGHKSQLSRSRRASDRTPAGPQLARRRALCAVRLIDNQIVSGWPAAGMVEARRMGRLVLASHSEGCYVLRTNQPRLELRGAVGEFPIASFPKRKRPFASIRASCGSRPIWHGTRGSRAGAHPRCAFSSTCCGRRWSSGGKSRAGLGDGPPTLLRGIRSHHQHRRHPARRRRPPGRELRLR